jgi:Ser/Thr protein kinase RdoA (MazF antagonist)
MANTISFDSLPSEIRTELNRIDKPESFSVERMRHEAITVVHKKHTRVYKFVRNNKTLLKQLDKEIHNLLLLRTRRIFAPMVLGRRQLKQYDMVAYSYIAGKIVEGNTQPKHAKSLAKAHRRLHLAFERDGQTKLAEWNSARVIKPILSKTNAAQYAPELVKYARWIGRELKAHEHARDDVTFIHSDSHLSNVVFQPERAVLIDWAEAGWASKYFELAVTIHSMLYERKVKQRDLIATYLNEYFDAGQLTERDVRLIELYVKLRFLESATWHLGESIEDQRLNKLRYAKFVENSWQKAERFNLANLLGMPTSARNRPIQGGAPRFEG